MRQWDTAEGRTARAPRIPLHVPLLYRSPGQADWQRGESENISRSGVLFRAPDVLDRGTPLEMGLVLVAGMDAPPQVVCFGNIVRATPCSDDTAVTVAARILGYRFVGSTPEV